jgi:hypothetical protein
VQRTWRGALHRREEGAYATLIVDQSESIQSEKRGREMKTRTRMMVMGLVLVAMLLLATVPAGARSKIITPVDAIEYTCWTEGPANEWYSDGGSVWHVRGLILHDIIVSTTEPRVNGTAIGRYHFDLNIFTGEGRAWGTAEYQVEGGIWRGLARGRYIAGKYSGHGENHGSHGLQGQFMYLEAAEIDPDPALDPCGEAGAIYAYKAEGYILEH